MNYTLTATNSQGASTNTYGDTIKECLIKFDNDYERKGFAIQIFDNLAGQIVRTVKKTTR